MKGSIGRSRCGAGTFQARRQAAAAGHTDGDDIQGFFDAIDQQLLLEKLAARISDRRVLKLLRQWLEAGVM